MDFETFRAYCKERVEYTSGSGPGVDCMKLRREKKEPYDCREVNCPARAALATAPVKALEGVAKYCGVIDTHGDIFVKRDDVIQALSKKEE